MERLAFCCLQKPRVAMFAALELAITLHPSDAKHLLPKSLQKLLEDTSKKKFASPLLVHEWLVG